MFIDAHINDVHVSPWTVSQQRLKIIMPKKQQVFRSYTLQSKEPKFLMGVAGSVDHRGEQMGLS